ncbi:hypothetical protein ONZ51_g585 [Trametes cubensis]|uniref:Uncharacterized protein n=1 Tax=Trametes cubensis TaxID=1111947 RepID=A0AAD7U5A2_9APHY|nr:hypothetical protein ONZ51_g585 [Trametes cubensis]
MPRLFPSLGRSSKDPGRNGAYGQYDGYDAPHGYYDYGYAEQESRHNRSPWSKMLSRKSTKRKYATNVDQQGIAPLGDRYRTTVVDYPEDQRPVVPGLPTDDSSSFEDFLSARNAADSTIPLVQRESSLTRLQQAFADNGTYAPALSAAPSASHGAPFYAPSPRAGIPGPMGQPHVSAVNDMHHSAMLVNSPVPQMQGIRPDIVHHSASYPAHERPHRRHRERERSAPPNPSYRNHPAYWEEPLDPNEEPPVVVVVEHGKHGKKDKYYIIPGGAPVIFEDEDGNELTRVGDFSGRYKPLRRPRPVIYHNAASFKLSRAGFGGDDHISVGSDNHSPHHTSRSSRTDPRGRPSHRSPDNRGYPTHQPSMHPSMHPSSQPMYGPAPDSYIRDPHYQTPKRTEPAVGSQWQLQRHPSPFEPQGGAMTDPGDTDLTTATVGARMTIIGETTDPQDRAVPVLEATLTTIDAPTASDDTDTTTVTTLTDDLRLTCMRL